ncbi:BamA/TamA family outer membrane protein [Paucibacter sp. AS339]|uniref:autotransporter assembly complex protein TamA n=1 Tax=Paucibacter hankyongi TaxID=3133434 RepID=UPI0030AF1011
MKSDLLFTHIWARCRPATWLLLCAASLVLPACSSLQNLGQALDPTAAAKADREANASGRRLVAEYTLQVQAPTKLKDLLEEHLDLARFRRAPEDQRLSPQELGRLSAAAPQQARALLETEGYFNADVTVERSDVLGRPEGRSSEPPTITVKVQPGPQAKISALELNFAGELLEPAPEHAADRSPSAALLAQKTRQRERLRRDWDLGLDAPFSQDAWSSAKSSLLGRVRTQGYPLARWSETAARVDAESNSVELALTLESGPLFRLGEIQITGLNHQPASVVERLAGFVPGEPYSERKMLDFQERLLKTTLFDTANVDIRPEGESPDHAASSTVYVQVKEAPRQQVTLSLGFDTASGPRIGADYTNRHPFGLDMRARTKLKLGSKESSADLELSSHPLSDMQRNLGALFVERLKHEDTATINLRARLGRIRETEREDRTYYLEALRAFENKPGKDTHAGAVSANVQWTLRRVDSTLRPTKGYTGSLLLGAGYADSSTEDNGYFGRSQLKLYGYYPLPGGWYSSARTEWGQIFAPASVGLPEKLRFRTGGDESVRGYGFEDLGPVDALGTATGGRVLWNGSVELAHAFMPSLPDLLGAVFADAGQTARTWGELKPTTSLGLGLRYRSPLGTLRLDYARATALQRWRLHFSVGIAL